MPAHSPGTTTSRTTYGAMAPYVVHGNVVPPPWRPGNAFNIIPRIITRSVLWRFATDNMSIHNWCIGILWVFHRPSTVTTCYKLRYALTLFLLIILVGGSYPTRLFFLRKKYYDFWNVFFRYHYSWNIFHTMIPEIFS